MRSGGGDPAASFVARPGGEGPPPGGVVDSALLLFFAQGGLVFSSASGSDAAAEPASHLLQALSGHGGAVRAGRGGRGVVEYRDGELALPPLEKGHDEVEGRAASVCCCYREDKERKKVEELLFSMFY